MNLSELASIIRFVRKTTVCPSCSKRYNTQDINVIASTKHECLLELKCTYCKKASLSDVVATPQGSEIFDHNERNSVPLINQIIKNGITEDDILDTKNFLNAFDGDFKKLFHK